VLGAAFGDAVRELDPGAAEEVLQRAAEKAHNGPV
jgi:hypothetical protein